MKYEKPKMELIVMVVEDVITLSVNNEADEVINGTNGNPWAQ